MGRLETPVRAYLVEPPRPYAQHRASVSVAFIEPRQSRAAFYRILGDNLRYLTIEVDGQVIYDSRSDVPCDMDHWAATNARFQGNRPMQTIHQGVPPGSS
jgi:hypothetical protein